MTNNRKTPTKPEALECLRNGAVRLPPLTLRLEKIQAAPESRGRYDALLAASWRGRRCLFALEYKSRSTPKVLQETIARIKADGQLRTNYPMLMTPFLSSEQLSGLEQREISGIDLCGNGVVIVPGEFCIFRTGQPNRYPQSGPIKNIYRGRSSLVPRVFLVRPEYAELNDVKREIEKRKGKIAISTISKIISTLDEALIVKRKNGCIRVLQPDALLDELAENYAAPRKTRQFLGRWEEEPRQFLGELFDEAGRAGIRSVVSGKSSVGQYALMARENTVQVYCSNIEAMLEALASSVKESSRFANLELIETDEDFVYFDARSETGIRWASPVQAYLDLMSGDKRDRETAEEIREVILGSRRMD